VTDLMANDVAAIAPYQSVALWQAGGGKRCPAWWCPMAGHRTTSGSRTHGTGAADPMEPIPVDAAVSNLSAEDWEGWLSPGALWPLSDPRDGLAGGLLLGGTIPDTGGNDAARDARRDVRHDARRRRSARPAPAPAVFPALAVGAAAVLALSFMPVRSSVLAPAEVVAAGPFPDRARFDRVVYSIYVPPKGPPRHG